MRPNSSPGALITPLHVAIAIHYATRCAEHPDLADGDVRAAAEDLVGLGMLEHIHDPESHAVIGYAKGGGLKVWIQAICETPLPVLRWVMPERPAA